MDTDIWEFFDTVYFYDETLFICDIALIIQFNSIPSFIPE